MDKKQSGPYRTHTRSAQNYRPPTCEDATATDMSDSQPERATRQHQREAGAEARPALQPTTANAQSSSRYTGQVANDSTYQQGSFAGHPFAPAPSTYNSLYPVSVNYSSSYQTQPYSGRYASNTSVPYSYGGQFPQPPFLYPPTTQPPVAYSDPRRYSYNDDYYQPEPTNQFPTRPPPPAPRPPRQNYGYEPQSAAPAPKTDRPPLPKRKVPARPASARPASTRPPPTRPPPTRLPPPENGPPDERLIKREMSRLKKRMAKLELDQEDLRSDPGRVRSEYLLPSASLAGRNTSSGESYQALENIRRIIDDCLRKTGRDSYRDSSVDFLEALVRDKLTSERRDSMEPKDDRSFAKRVIEVLQDYETQNGRWERTSTTGGRSTTREEKRRSMRSTTSSDPPLEPLTPPSSYSMPQRSGKASNVSPERPRETDYVYDAPRRSGSTRAVHSEEESTVPRPPMTRRPETDYSQGTGRRRRQSMVEPERGGYEIPRRTASTRVYGTSVAQDDDDVEYDRRRRPTTATDRRRPTSFMGGLGQRFRTDPTSAPSSSTRWSREGGVYDAR
ncbi:hypothetical protein ACHAPT_003934 [Fusarium lateritium]